MLARQQSAVDEWSSRAIASEARGRAHRDAIHAWKEQRFGSPWMLGWAFAAGALWGAGRHVQSRKGKATKKYLGLANTILLAWRILGSRM
jgi:hypothetical protein